MSTAAKQAPQRSAALTEAVRARTAATTRVKASEPDAQFANITGNPFYQVVFAPDKSPEQKRAELAKALTFTGTKLENRERIKAFELFKEYLSHVREEMAQDIIKLTNTETFAELQQVYSGLNNDLIEFDNAMAPLTNILDALYTLRTNGVTFDAFREIGEDRKREQELASTLAEKSWALSGFDEHVNRLQEEIATLSEDKSWGGFGSIKEESRKAIAVKQVELDRTVQELQRLKSEVESLKVKPQQDAGKYAEEKKRLRELLDISSDEHRERQKKLVETALNFVTTAKTRVGSVRNHLGKMNDQVDNLFDANSNMTTIFAVMNEAIKDASNENQKVRETLVTAPETEDAIAKVTREQKRMDVEQYIKVLGDTERDTLTTYADLTSQQIRIKSMKDANDAQVDKARTLGTQGIAGVADRISVVLQAVSAAALGESSSMAKDTLMRMSDNTNAVAQKEVIRTATGIDEINVDLAKALDDLGAYGEVSRTASQISRAGLTEMRDKLEQMKELANETIEAVHDSIGVAADVASGGSSEEKKKTTSSAPSNPFASMNAA